MSASLNEDILAHHIQLAAEHDPSRRIMTFESARRADRALSLGELWTNANRLAAFWHERGLRKGDCVAVLMRNYPEYIYALVASSISGVLSVAIDPRTKGEKLAFQLAKCSARLAMCTPDLLENVDAVRASSPVRDILVHCPEGVDAPQGAHIDLAGVLSEPRPTFDHQVHALHEPHQIIYTSGTTGDPKAFVLDHQRALAAKRFIALMNATPDDVFYTGLSLTHANAQMMTAYPALWYGAHAVISESFTKTRLWDICRRHGCTTFTSLGGIMSGLYAEPTREDDSDNPVRIVHSAGTPRAIWSAFERRFGVRIHEWYGTLEGGVATRFPNSTAPVGSFGKPLPNTWDMRVVRPDFSECAPGEIGQLIARPVSGEPYQVVYFKDPEASARKTRDGWLLSGDMVHTDEHGWLYFDFREGGGIRRNGDFVHPDYVERVLAEHPQVTDVFVYGVPARSGAPGERDVVAAVVPIDTATFDIASVFDKCRSDLEPNSVPAFLQVVEEIPKTISEKPQQHRLEVLFDPEAPNVYSEAGR